MNKFTLTAAAAAVAFAAAMPAQAATLLGVKVGADAWLTSGKTEAGSFSKDADDKTMGSFHIAFEHFIPLVPNARIRYSEVDNGTVSFNQMDYTAYYEILDNDAVALDLGVVMSKFNAGKFAGQSFSEWQPAVYGAGEIGIPMTPVSAFGDLTYGTYDDTKTVDAQIGVKWTIPLLVDLNLRAGYRVMDHDFAFINGYNSVKVKNDGWFLGVEVDI
ncbi:TIGR04219 family outer membrane beta-barrel protein [Photobacterium sanguinicancri]|uniref:TIGR04219 family outer membrane beta-barrel protein n=1 Tax=Photobacterium sanguinicancri TaxID=875932 RepID=A0AAW7Y9M9_9GAMM|nr:TIGR04219 family outer membrane beta-barrel protein [Photobacterium sanguinicancri]KXI21612.1 Fe3+-hydroxamate ABC transporter substrate-binding protein [Photobacterium sanguinicancri]MDO6544620.1 TIGR04219 family outer membrane beta-barrel protein [Photobacterium sanguinicancri]